MVVKFASCTGFLLRGYCAIVFSGDRRNGELVWSVDVDEGLVLDYTRVKQKNRRAGLDPVD
jgi:hypothetical protein